MTRAGKTSLIIVMLGMVVMAACGPSNQPQEIEFQPSPGLETTTSVDLNETIPDITTTTIVEEPPAVPVPVTEPEIVEERVEERPILCPGYSHPLHHLTCDEAARQNGRSKVTSTPTTTTPSSGLPRTASVGNLSSLPACIAYYESTSGQADSNIYQFVPSTWAAYGGEGNPENASVGKQTEVFWVAWADGGPQHWAAQKGRCF